jgi:hypothetical protein
LNYSQDIPRQAQEGLSLLGPTGDFDDKSFGVLVQLCFRVLAHEIDVNQVDKAIASIKTDAGICKEAYASLIGLILEGCRQDADSQELSSIIDDKISKERVEHLQKLYNSYKSTIRQKLQGTSNLSAPSIIGIDWRLDYYVMSSALEQIRVPVYFVDIKTLQVDGSTKKVQFTCSLQELEDLLAKCKDALNSVKLLKAES